MQKKYNKKMQVTNMREARKIIEKIIHKELTKKDKDNEKCLLVSKRNLKTRLGDGTGIRRGKKNLKKTIKNISK